jgi:hypothetical protein
MELRDFYAQFCAFTVCDIKKTSNKILGKSKNLSIINAISM